MEKSNENDCSFPIEIEMAQRQVQMLENEMYERERFGPNDRGMRDRNHARLGTLLVLTILSFYSVVSCLKDIYTDHTDENDIRTGELSSVLSEKENLTFLNSSIEQIINKLVQYNYSYVA